MKLGHPSGQVRTLSAETSQHQADHFIDSPKPRCYQSALRHERYRCLLATALVSRAGSLEEGFGIDWEKNGPARGRRADVAQAVERLTCNQQVVGSTPTIGSMFGAMMGRGEVPERPKGADCKSAGVRLRRFESSPLHSVRGNRTTKMRRGSSSVGRARAFQARGRGFDSRLPLVAASVGIAIDGYAHVAQSAEHFLGKEEVTGSNPVVGSETAA
jgi:hypothetical protein